MMQNFIPLNSRSHWISIEKCKDGYAYYIHARNAKVGIYDQKEKGFVISRQKGGNCLFVEHHWDVGEPYGTVKPIKELEAAPNFKDDVEKLDWLNKKSDMIKENPWGDAKW